MDFAGKFSDQELDELYANFLNADADNSGALDYVEFCQLLTPYVKVSNSNISFFIADY